MSTEVEIKHGTYAGYQTHRRKGIDPCPECRAAQTEYIRTWRSRRDASDAEWDRAKNNARSRALWRLADRHPAEFEIYVAEELWG